MPPCGLVDSSPTLPRWMESSNYFYKFIFFALKGIYSFIFGKSTLVFCQCELLYPSLQFTLVLVLKFKRSSSQPGLAHTQTRTYGHRHARQ